MHPPTRGHLSNRLLLFSALSLVSPLLCWSQQHTKFTCSFISLLKKPASPRPVSLLRVAGRLSRELSALRLSTSSPRPPLLRSRSSLSVAQLSGQFLGLVLCDLSAAPDPVGGPHLTDTLPLPTFRDTTPFCSFLRCLLYSGGCVWLHRSHTAQLQGHRPGDHDENGPCHWPCLGWSPLPTSQHCGPQVFSLGSLLRSAHPHCWGSPSNFVPTLRPPRTNILHPGSCPQMSDSLILLITQ